jgi:phosphoglycerol transferase MdoB-like AlkP superfamily enzyme
LALTYVCVSGVNIWLAKRNRADRTEAAWVATIWATPSALLLSLLVGVFYPTAVVISFFAGFTLMVVAAVCYNNIAACRRLLQLSCGVFALLTVILYSVIHHQYWQSSVIITINLSLVAIAVLCLSLSRRSAVEQQSGLRPIDGEIVS